jgi:6-phosphogluconate dehydrogenase
MGPDGAGHFVKMVHNGIEYADMQFIAEAYDLLRGAGLEPTRIAEVFREWNTGALDSFLIQITAEVLAHVDAATGRPFVDVVADAAEQLAPAAGRCSAAWSWACPPTPSPGPCSPGRPPGTLGCGRRPGRPCPVPTGERSRTPSSWSRTSGRRCGPPRSSPMRRGSTSSAPPATPTTGTWTWPRWPGSGGPAASSGPTCWSASARRTATPTSRLCWPPRHRREARAVPGRLAPDGRARGDPRVPVPGFASALAYYDTVRRDRLPAALIQGLRDFFGAHTYRRVDREGVFHTLWSEDWTEREV